MRKWATLLLLWGIALPAMAAKSLSIEQMEQLLSKLQGKPDGKIVAALDEVQVTERVSPARLVRWEEEFPGARTREALMKLADLSAFQNPPAADVLRDPVPDMQTQQQMANRALDYVKTTTSRLPDFFATRQTSHFENTILQHVNYTVGSIGAGKDEHQPLSDLSLTPSGVASSTEFAALHAAGTTSTTVTFRGGREVYELSAGKREKQEGLGWGMTTSGEFGPILVAVIGDVMHTGVRWLRWEQGASNPVAVYSYAVPASESHFRVGMAVRGKAQELFPAYHGEIAIDPESGAILRLSEVADMPPSTGTIAAIVVEYAPVTIGEHSYICPVKGVAYSKVPVPSGGALSGGVSGTIQTALNDVTFTHYHLFAVSARMVPSEGADNGATAASESAPPAAAAEASAAPASSPAAAVTASPTGQSNEAAVAPAANPAAAPAEQTSAATASSSAPAQAAEPTVAPAAPLTATAMEGEAPTGTVIHAISRLVLVDVTVTEHDRPVTGLERSRFHVFEDGHEQTIASFEENKPAVSVEVAEPPALPPGTYTNLPVYPEASAVNVLLLDALNTPLGDQQYVRQQMLSYLKTAKPGTSMAIFVLSSRLEMAAGFTTDLARLAQTLQNKKATPRAAADVGAGAGESMSSSLDQLASSVASANDPLSRWMVGQLQASAADNAAYENDQRVRITLDALSGLARYLAAVPGKKNLIWFSGSFPIGVGPEALQRAALKNVSDYGNAMRRMDALLTAARVAVYPVNAVGVSTVQNADSTSVPAPVNGINNPGQSVAGGNAGRAEQMSLDQDAMNAIAADTGGRAYQTANDLKTAVDRIMANDSSYYALSYVPPQETGHKDASRFHAIEVTIDGAKVQLAYRRGYYPDQPVNTAAAGTAPAAVTGAAQLGAPPATQILFRAQVLPEGDPAVKGPVLDPGPPSKALTGTKGGLQRYVVDLGVNPLGMTFTDELAGAKHTQLECVLMVYGSGGTQLNQVGRVLDFNVSAAQYTQLLSAGTEFPVRLALDLPVGASVLRIVVYDPASARTGSLEIPVVTPAGKPGRQTAAD